MTVAINAIGNHVPPVLILSRVHFKNHMLTGAPTASLGGANPTGWPKEWLCFDCLKHFIACERPCKEDTVLLILDNHESHLSIPAAKVAKENDIFLLRCHPIHPISHNHWLAPSLVCTNQVIMLALVTGCCQTHAK
jgi:hypothetical protein